MTSTRHASTQQYYLAMSQSTFPILPKDPFPNRALQSDGGWIRPSRTRNRSSATSTSNGSNSVLSNLSITKFWRATAR